MNTAITNYASGDVRNFFIVAAMEKVAVYVEYIGKKNVLKPMVVMPVSIKNSYAIVADLGDEDKIKRLNFNGVYRIGLKQRQEVGNA